MTELTLEQLKPSRSIYELLSVWMRRRRRDAFGRKSRSRILTGCLYGLHAGVLASHDWDGS